MPGSRSTRRSLVNMQFPRSDGPFDAIAPLDELGAYEALWAKENVSFRKISEAVRATGAPLLTSLVSRAEIATHADLALGLLATKGVQDFGVHVRLDASYPDQLLDAEYPVELLYFRGEWELVYTPSVAIVGTRQASLEGIKRAKRLSRLLVEDGYTIVSGLARGIDTAAHTAAIKAGGRTIAVIGTSIAAVYPPENAALQEDIATNHLLISQVPIVRHFRQGPAGNRLFFPERNITMSALTRATIIVEAADSSGTLTQARAALKQGGRKLFILDSCFRNSKLTWPERFEALGAIRVRDFSDIQRELGSVETPDAD